jgi:tyrosyl-tRNA synthetase
MTQLVQRDYIAKRIGEGGAGISYTEFSYTLLQGMDFLHLYDNYGVNLQLGGSDQWGNCLSGVDLVRRARGAEVHTMTLPLVINKATGKKFGKSEEGAVWLNESKTSVYKFYQFWLNLDDDGIEYYMKLYTELDKPTIDSIMAEFNTNRAGRIAQKTLAYEVTKLVHGQAKADAVKKVSEVLFGGESADELGPDEFAILKADLTTIKAEGESIAQIAVRAGLAASLSEANRFISGGGLSLNGEKITADAAPSFKSGDNLLKRGKNNFAVIEN